MDARSRQVLSDALEAATFHDKVDLAAFIQLTLEREAQFCRDCGLRVGMKHADTCIHDGWVVNAIDTPNIPEEIERRVVQLRSGFDIPTDQELRAPQPITRKVRKLRPDLWRED